MKLEHSLTPSLVAQLVKNPPATWETWIQSLGWKNPLEKGTLKFLSLFICFSFSPCLLLFYWVGQYTPFVFKVRRREQIPRQESKAFTDSIPPSDCDFNLSGSHSTTSSCKGAWGTWEDRLRGLCWMDHFHRC